MYTLDQRKQERHFLMQMITLFFITAAAIALTFVLFYHRFENSYRTEIENQLMTVNELKKQALKAWYEERSSDAAVLYDNPSFSALVRSFLHNPDNDSAKRHLQNWLEKFQSEYGYDQVGLLDNSGVFRFVTPEMEASVSLNTGEIAHLAITRRKAIFSDFYRNDFNQKVFISTLVPLYEGAIPLGCIRFRIDPSRYLYTIIDFWPISLKSAETILCRRDGDSVSFINKLKFIDNKDLNLRISLTRSNLPSVKAVLGRCGIVYGEDYRGASVIAAIDSIPGSSWFICSKLDLEEVNIPLELQFTRMLVELFVLITLCALLLVLLWRQRCIKMFKAREHIMSERVIAEQRHREQILKAEKALQESEELFDQIADNVNEIFFLYDFNAASVLYVNNAVEKILGISPVEIQAKKENLFELILSEDRERLGISPGWFEKNNKSSIECRVHHADGSLVWIQLRTFPVYDPAGTVFRIAGLAADITLQKEMELREREHQQQLQQADKMATIGRLVSGVAHEINNPNNFIMLNAPLLRKAWESALPCIKAHQGEAFYIGKMRFQDFSDYIFPLLDGILDGSKRIARIVSDLKDYARPEADTTSQVVDFRRVIQAGTNLMSNTFVKKNIGVEVDLGSNPVPVRGYAQKLEQVVINLLQNSCDAFTSKGQNLITLNLDTSSSGDVRLYVQDNGCGISPEDLLHITEPFYTTKRCHGGMGLGLSVSHKIIVDHGGQLQFQSKVGKGTTAIIILPKGNSVS